MASPAYCILCFETLSASFQGSEPPALSKIEELWDLYECASKGIVNDQVKNGDMDQDEDGNSDEEEEDTDSESPETLTSDKPNPRPASSATLLPPSVARLQSSSSSSSSSTPVSSSSAVSAASSTTSYSSMLSKANPESSYPLFVTWNSHSPRTGSKHLRGCIGTFEPLPLAQGLENYALTSAFEDHRFNPIPASLLPQLSCAITLLADFTTCKDPMDWELGTHGIRISFLSRSGNRRYGATYLPDVAVEQGWTKEETIESLMRKAGWDGSSFSSSSSSYTAGVARRLLRGTSTGAKSNATDTSESESEQQKKPWNQVSDFKTVRYTGLKADLTYSEWQDWRSWVDSNGLAKALRSR